MDRNMVDKSINRGRVARHSAKKVGEGYRLLTVYLSPETTEMMTFLQPHFRTRRKNAKLIATAIKALMKKPVEKNE